MPHGLTVDVDGGYVWLSDVGAHQVYKYNFNSTKNDGPLLTLGEKFVNGNDKTHFCKPTTIAISNINKDIFVADGYCNERIGFIIFKF